MKKQIIIKKEDLVMDDMEEVRSTHITRTGGLSPTGPRTMDTKRELAKKAGLWKDCGDGAKQ